MNADLGSWLQALGLARYAGVFADNGVDLDAVRLLTEADLQALGVLLGHRRKLLRAVAELGGGTRRANDIGRPGPGTPVSSSPHILQDAGALLPELA